MSAMLSADVEHSSSMSAADLQRASELLCYDQVLGENCHGRKQKQPTKPNKSACQSNLGRGPRRGTVAHVYAVKSPLVTMARPKFALKSTPFRGAIAKPHYLPHPWTRPTNDAKRHPDPIRGFSTMHWTDRRTDRQIAHGEV